MELFDKEREIRRLQFEKEIAIANAEEDAIKRIIDEDKLSIKEEKKRETRSRYRHGCRKVY